MQTWFHQWQTADIKTGDFALRTIEIRNRNEVVLKDLRLVDKPKEKTDKVWLCSKNRWQEFTSRVIILLYGENRWRRLAKAWKEDLTEKDMDKITQRQNEM